MGNRALRIASPRKRHTRCTLISKRVTFSPVCCERPWVIDEDLSRVAQIAKAMRMVVAVNILGLPACALPVGCDDGLPQGVQLIGARFREDLLLDAAQAIEDRAPVLTPIQPRRTVGVSAPGSDRRKN